MHRTLLAIVFAPAAFVALCGTPLPSEAQVFRCDIGGKTVYQQVACEVSGGKGTPIAIQPAPPATRVAAPLPVRVKPEEPAPPPPPAGAIGPQQPSPAQAKSELQSMADACLDWYRPRLRNPNTAYHRDAQMGGVGGTVLSLVIYGTNGFGGYVGKPAACEVKNGLIDQGWTRTHAGRNGW